MSSTSSKQFLPTFAAFWTGPYLSWLERMCLKSFVARGHRVILYVRDPVLNVPEGIEQRSASEVFEPGYLIAFDDENKSPALHSDYFRWHLQEKTDYIYIDSDMFCLNPVTRFSRESLKKQGAVCGVLFFRMPENSPTTRFALSILSDALLRPRERTLGPTVARYLYQLRPNYTLRIGKILFMLRKILSYESRKILGYGGYYPLPNKWPWGGAGGYLLEYCLQVTQEAVDSDGMAPFIKWLGRVDESMLLPYLSADVMDSEISANCDILFLTHGIAYINGEYRSYFPIMPISAINVPPKKSWFYEKSMELGLDPADAPQLDAVKANHEARLKFIKPLQKILHL